mgnify:CR=1 FL=1
MLTEHPTNEIVEDTHFADILTESPQEPAIDATEEH